MCIYSYSLIVWVKENPIIAHYVEASYIAGHHDRWTLSVVIVLSKCTLMLSASHLYLYKFLKRTGKDNNLEQV
jgi:hypothetical protein